MSAYALAHVRSITLGPEVTEYLEKIDATLASFGGRFVVHGGPVEVLEGTWQGDLIMIRFPDRRSAQAWYRSPQYQAIVRLRTAHSDGDCILVDGVRADHKATDILAGERSQGEESVHSDPATVTRAFRRYVETFQTLDATATLRHLHLPCMFIDPRGVRVMSSEREAEELLTMVMRDLRTRGYARSEITELHVHLMNDRTALLSVSRVRYTSSGEEMERLGETYALRNLDDDWKIVVAMVHDPGAVLRA
jgi:uncharacterized protein (DUF1330 family)/ketosteroid isomerase-like protein